MLPQKPVHNCACRVSEATCQQPKLSEAAMAISLCRTSCGVFISLRWDIHCRGVSGEWPTHSRWNVCCVWCSWREVPHNLLHCGQTGQGERSNLCINIRRLEKCFLLQENTCIVLVLIRLAAIDGVGGDTGDKPVVWSVWCPCAHKHHWSSQTSPTHVSIRYKHKHFRLLVWHWLLLSSREL